MSENFIDNSRHSKHSLHPFVLGVYLPLQIFVLLATAVSLHQQGLLWDKKILLAIHTTAQTQLDKIAAILTQFGIYWGVVPVVIVLALIFGYLKQWHRLAYLLITAIGAIVISDTSKLLFHRVRPHLWNSFYHQSPSYAFPSGHALSSMTLVVVLAVLTYKSRWFWWVICLGSLFVLAIGWTRLYLGVHYPSDILGGWLLSLAWAIAMSPLSKNTSE